MRAIVILCVATLFGAGCTYRSHTRDGDSGTRVVDGGPIMDGAPVGSCSVTLTSGYPALPSACLPRCEAATADCVSACAPDDAACTARCYADNSMPPIAIVVNGMTVSLDCLGCIEWQSGSCFTDSCPDQVRACFGCGECDEMTPGCEAEQNALRDCITAHSSAVGPCFASRAPLCLE